MVLEFFRGEALSFTMDLLRLPGEGSLSEPPLPEPWVPGCMRAWETA